MAFRPSPRIRALRVPFGTLAESDGRTPCSISGIELVDAFGRGKIGLERFDRRFLVPQRSRRPFDLRLVRRD
jgi:hypothetical protein